MERLEGLDEEFQKEETEKVTSIEETKKKRPPFHYWEVAGVQHKMKLNTGMITKLENKYRTNIMTLVTANDIPPLGVMLTIAQAAIEPWEHGTTFDKVTKLCPVFWVLVCYIPKRSGKCGIDLIFYVFHKFFSIASSK